METKALLYSRATAPAPTAPAIVYGAARCRRRFPRRSEAAGDRWVQEGLAHRSLLTYANQELQFAVATIGDESANDRVRFCVH